MEKIKRFWSVAKSSIVLLVMFFTKLDLVSTIERYLTDQMKSSLADQAFRLTVNTAIVLIIFEWLNIIFDKYVKVIVNIRNLDGTESTNIVCAGERQRYKTLHIDIEIDYKTKGMKYVINSWLKGIELYIYNSNWISVQVENKNDLGEDAVDDDRSNQYLVIRLEKLLSEGEIDNPNVRLIYKIQSNSIDSRNGEVSAKIHGKSRMKTFILSKLMVDFKCKKHRIQSSRVEE